MKSLILSTAGAGALVFGLLGGAAHADHLNAGYDACRAGDRATCQSLYAIATSECAQQQNQYSCQIAAELEASLGGGGQQQPETLGTGQVNAGAVGGDPAAATGRGGLFGAFVDMAAGMTANTR